MTVTVLQFWRGIGVVAVWNQDELSMNKDTDIRMQESYSKGDHQTVAF